MARRIPNVDEMFDILSSMQAGKFATFCYVNVAKVKKTKKGVDLDAFGRDLDDNHVDGDDHWYGPLKKYQQDASMKKNPIYAVVSVTRYNLNWSSEDSYNKNYSNYSNKKDDIDKKWGIYKDPSERREGGFSDVNGYGISVGNTDKTKDRAYIHQNTFNANKKTTYYIIGDDGEIKGEVPYNAIRALMTKTSPAGTSALQKLNKTDDEIKNYLSEIDSLKFKPGKFLIDRILYIVATVNGEEMFYINDRLPSEIEKTHINASSFIEKANKLFNESFREVTEACKNFKDMIFESRIKKALHESLRKFKIIK